MAVGKQLITGNPDQSHARSSGELPDS